MGSPDRSFGKRLLRRTLEAIRIWLFKRCHPKFRFLPRRPKNGELEQLFFFWAPNLGPNVFHFEGFLGPINHAPEGPEVFFEGVESILFTRWFSWFFHTMFRRKNERLFEILPGAAT